MSAHATPVLSGAIPSFELFMTQWERLGKEYRTLKPWTDIGLKWARKYYSRMDDTRAYIIAMCELSFFFQAFDWSTPGPQLLTHVYASRGLRTNGAEIMLILPSRPSWMSYVNKMSSYVRNINRFK